MTTRRARPPQSLPPEVRELIALQNRSRVSRRSFFRGAGGLGAAALLTACGTAGTGGAPAPAASAAPTAAGPAPAQDVSATEKTLAWANWTLYLDYDDETKTYPTLEEFKKQTGIDASYSEDIDGNDTYYGKVQGQLANGQDIGKDIVVLTDWMAGRMVRMGYTQTLDLPGMPNVNNLLPQLRDVDFDPGRAHTLTWQSGFAGIAWNKEEVPGGLRTVSDLWRPELKGRVEVLDEWRDTIGLIMSEQGVDISSPTWGPDQFGAALDVLEKQIVSGQIRQVKGNSYKEDLVSGDAVAVTAWSGDITQLNAENDDKFAFAVPDGGGTLFSDNMMVPIGARHKANAEKLMNYYYDPTVAATVAAYVNYICPVSGAKEAMEKIDPALVSNTSIFPDDATLAKVKLFRMLTPNEEADFGGRFQKTIGN
ncbi:MAG TPA: spermidine/putrescine ABC transporter substrate-binding protein [Pseudonocardia sp.]